MSARAAACAALVVAACVAGPVPTAHAADACAVGGDVSGGTMELVFACPRTSEYSGTSYATVTWSGTSGHLTLTPPYSLPIGDLTGPCDVDAAASHFRCTVSGDGRVLAVEWLVTDHSPDRVAGAGTILELDGPPHSGFSCGFASTWDLDGDGTATGEIEGGPVTADGELVTLTCTLRIGVDTDHNAPVFLELSSGPSAVAVVPPTVVQYPSDVWLSLCSKIEVGGETWYLANTYYSFWTTDPTQPCTHSTLEWRPEPEIVPLEGLLHLAEGLNGLFYPLDAIICPLVLVPLFPPEGDVPGLWDCPPYGNAA